MFSISTMVQQDNFLTYIKNSKYAYYYPLFVFMLETALRVGEVCGLTWDDVDLEHGFVNITHQLQYNNVGKDACQYQILTPKSKSGVRNVPLSNAARDALMEQMKNQIEMDKKTEIEIDGYKDFVFSNRQNKAFHTHFPHFSHAQKKMHHRHLTSFPGDIFLSAELCIST